MKFKLGTRSRKNLEGVHPDLVKVVELAITITEVDFMVIEGIRSEQRQWELVAAGASTTTRSRHLTGHAVDLAAWVDNTIRWDWPLYHRIAASMFKAAHALDIPIEWGGHWPSFPDGPHFELPHEEYPPIV